VPEHQLDDAYVDAVRQEAASALVTQIVPVQIDHVELGAIDARTRLRSRSLVGPPTRPVNRGNVTHRQFRQFRQPGKL
jgi:hypothetical protein